MSPRNPRTDEFGGCAAVIALNPGGPKGLPSGKTALYAALSAVPVLATWAVESGF